MLTIIQSENQRIYCDRIVCAWKRFAFKQLVWFKNIRFGYYCSRRIYEIVGILLIRGDVRRNVYYSRSTRVFVDEFTKKLNNNCKENAYSPSILSTLDDELALYSGEEIFFSPLDDRTVMVRLSLSVRRRRRPMSTYRTVMNVIGNTKNSNVDNMNDTVDSSTPVSINSMVRMLHWIRSDEPSNDETVNCKAYEQTAICRKKVEIKKRIFKNDSNRVDFLIH